MRTPRGFWGRSPSSFWGQVYFWVGSYKGRGWGPGHGGVAGGQGPELPSPHTGAARVALTAVDRHRAKSKREKPRALLNNAGASTKGSWPLGQHVQATAIAATRAPSTRCDAN